MTDANGNKIIGGEQGGSRAPILASLYRTIRYHLGTIAFASLIIATVQFIRITVKYIEQRTRTNPPNYLQKAIFCILQCCLKCIEWSANTQATEQEKRELGVSSAYVLWILCAPAARVCAAAWTRSARTRWCGRQCGETRSWRQRTSTR